MNFKSIYFLFHFLYSSHRIQNYFWKAQYNNSCKIWSKMSPIHLLVLLVIWLKKSFTSRAKDHRFTSIIRIATFAVGNHRLLLAQDPWAVSDVSFEYLGFHLVHTFDRLNVPLMEQAIQLGAFLPDILAVTQISFAEFIHELLHLIPALNHLECGIVVLDSFYDRRIFVFVSIVVVSIWIKVIEVILIVFPLLKAI